MRRAFITLAIATVVVGASAIAALLVGANASAAIDGNTFSSTTHNVRMTLPRGWRWAEQPTYPGIIMRLFHTRPRATMLLAVDPLDEVLANVAAECQTRKASDTEAATIAPIAIQIACQQRRRLDELGFRVASIKETDRPWFDYTADRRDLRQGVAVLGESVFTLILAADTSAVRAQYARTFDKMLRSLRALEAGADDEAPADQPAPAPDAGS